MIVEYLLSGQFWAANFFALVATIYWSFSGTGMSSGNLRHQVTLTNWNNRIRFAGMFLLYALLLNAAIGGGVAGLHATGLV
jgi:hypothetical protein